MGPDRDRTCDPWICSQTRICSQTHYRLRYAAWSHGFVILFFVSLLVLQSPCWGRLVFFVFVLWCVCSVLCQSCVFCAIDPLFCSLTQLKIVSWVIWRIQISGLMLIFAACGSKLSSSKNKLMFSYWIPNAIKQILGAWVISRELNESHLSLASDW